MNFRQMSMQMVGLGFVAMTVVGCAKPNNEGTRLAAPAGQANPPMQMSAIDGEMQTLAITKDVELETLNNEGDSVKKTVKLAAGTEVTIVRKAQLADIGEVAEVRIDSDDLESQSEALVRMSDLEEVSMPTGQGLSPLDAALAGADEEQILMENAARGRRGTPSCYRDVKFELLRRGLVKTYPPGAAAWMGYDVLRRQYGFRPVAFSQNLPNGAVCVSEGGRFRCGSKACGHIAVKIGAKRWYGAGVFQHPLLRKHYNLRCLVK